ncbi:DNA polymerase III subunit beta [Streptomyces sp. H27-G5]|uniref:DNA polymerase III subunit beta n=1 Tax=Streptomyces sp. H27-G5 TaxID=2996698 RepID=UPI00226DCA20|nr:DNA polymerase III subunit beta [Streptomyces sp. H27-G5]MCY0922329.1 DNA polymerase III subunit beta [Streptomyces sp. H27-G5]
MKLTLNTETLTEALRPVGRRVPTRPDSPAAAGLRLTATGDTLRLLAAGDLATSARTAVPALVHEDGTAVLPGRMLHGLARTLPAGAPLDLTVEGRLAHLQFGGTRISIPLLEADEYPQQPDLPKSVGTVAGKDIAAAVHQIAVAAGCDDTLPMLTGIRFELVGNTLKLTATDRYRLAVQAIPIQRAARRAPSALCVIPAKDLRATVADFRRAESVTVGLPTAEEQQFSLSAGALTVTHRPLDAKHYPDISKVVPTSFGTQVVLDRAALMGVLTRAVTVAGAYVPVNLAVEPGGPVIVTGGSRYEARTREELTPRSCKGAPVRIAFNPGFLLAGLRVLKSRTVQLDLTTEHRPGVLHTPGVDRSALSYLLMPVRTVSDAPMPN